MRRPHLTLLIRFSPARCRAFTLVELLVVIAIIGILTAMVLPAIQSSRESGRQLECLNKLRQVGIAIETYKTSKGRFPSGAIYRAPPAGLAGLPQHSLARWSALAQILPQLEEGNLARKLQTDIPLYFFGDPRDVHKEQVATLLPIFLCPSDEMRKVDEIFGPTNYAVCTGNGFDVNGQNGGTPFDTTGIFGVNSGIKDAHLLDGASKTSLASESILGVERPTSFNGVQNAIVTGDYRYTFSLPLSDSACSGSTQFNNARARGFSWADGDFRSTMYNHFYPPNAEQFDCIANRTDGDATVQWSVHGLRTARSKHRGTVGMVMADTSTKTVADTIDATVWQAWSTRKGGETVSAE